MIIIAICMTQEDLGGEGGWGGNTQGTNTRGGMVSALWSPSSIGSRLA